MNDPLADRPEARASGDPDVSTAPPGAATSDEGPQAASTGGWWSRVPDHLGRARTSTVVLAVLFLALGFLYLTVRPDPTGVARSPVGDTPATAPGTTEPTETAPTEPTEPTETVPTESTEPSEPTESGVPATSEPPTPGSTAPDDGSTETSSVPEPPARGAPEVTPGPADPTG